MNQNQRQICLSIVREIREHPAAAPFRNPVNLEEFPTYLETIDEPIDLGLIEERLKSRDYRSVREFKRDMALIWENTYAFAGPSSWAAVLANHIRSLFERRLRRISTANLEGWLGRVSELQTEFNTLVKRPPEKCEKSAPLDLLARKDLTPFGPADYKEIISGIKSLSQEDRKKLGSIIGRKVKQNESEIRMTYLPLDKLHKARDFVRERMPAKRIPSLMGAGPSTAHDM